MRRCALARPLPIRTKLAILLGLAGLTVAGNLLLGMARLREIDRSKRVGGAVEEARTELLLQVAYVNDLLAARQKGQNVAETEAAALLRQKSESVTRGLEHLEEGGGPNRLPFPDTDEVRNLCRDANERWTPIREAVDATIAGRQVLRNRDYIHAKSIELAHLLTALSVRAEARGQGNVAALKREAILAGTLLLLLLGAAAWICERSIFRALDGLVMIFRELGNTTPQADVHVPVVHDDELGELSRYLNAFLDRLRAADHTKDRFLAAMSHEIRTPMHGVIGFLDNLGGTDLNERQRQYVRLIHSSARSLLHVINEVLDFSKLSAGKMELEEIAFDLGELLEERVAVTRQLAKDKRLSVVAGFDGAAGLVVRGDPTRLRQVLDNLLANAVKFTDRGEIRLLADVTPDGEEATRIRFAVEDTGVGIPPERAKRIFEAFAQAERSTVRRYGGTGLGLCIASNLVELMGGALELQSRPGAGTSFEFSLRLPVAPREEQVRFSEHYDVLLEPGSLKRYWALLVDDTPTNLFLMETICQDIGLPYRTATNGREALDLCGKQVFDLIFMDIQMPVMDGYTAIREIRKLESAQATQIIALTASAFQEDVERALGAGSAGFMAKPFDRNHLLLCISEHLGVPVRRVLRDLSDPGESKVDITVRHMYDFMHTQYRLDLGEIKMILAQSMQDWRPLLKDVEVFAKQGTWDTVKPIMHRLKGQLGATGLPEFADTAGQITAAIRAGETDGLQQTVADFVAGLSDVFRVAEQEVAIDRPKPH